MPVPEALLEPYHLFGLEVEDLVGFLLDHSTLLSVTMPVSVVEFSHLLSINYILVTRSLFLLTII